MTCGRKTAVIYCLDVETFLDWNDDGRGDFAGWAQRIAYLADLGVSCLWLMPFYPTPDRDDGYDITDFYGVDRHLAPTKTKQYYLHRFYRYQPDLNVTNPVVRDEIVKIMVFWLELGLSGFRVDAVPFLLETLGTEGAQEACPIRTNSSGRCAPFSVVVAARAFCLAR